MFKGTFAGFLSSTKGNIINFVETGRAYWNISITILELISSTFVGLQ